MALSRRGGRNGDSNRRSSDRRGSTGRSQGSDTGRPNEIPLPHSARRWARHNQHPGLALDKLAESLDGNFEPPAKLSQQIQRPTIDKVVRLTAEFSKPLYTKLLAKQQRLVAALRAITFEGTTSGPVTLHLARASSLENAGIALHRVYGLPYLPATGLKGLARAYAETVWFPTQFRKTGDGQPDGEEESRRAEEAWRKIESVFGWSPGSDRDKSSYKPRSIAPPEHDASVGAVVFHDAWCTQVPRLEADILNNHHSDYYQGRSPQPPGDWDDPVPVYFLTISAGQTFQFAVSLRRHDRETPVAVESLELARQWLIGGLATLGGGAKTNAGYGRFDFSEQTVDAKVLAEALKPWRTAEELGMRGRLQVELELATPAFLAGAEQFGDTAPAGCDLRPATLRGLLRWWWRTMHAGFLTAEQLRELESAIFGDTEQAAALQLTVKRGSDGGVEEFNYKDGSKPKRDFKQEFGLADQKTTQGLFYAAYGMDDGRRNEPRRRFFRQPGQRWTIELVSRPVQRRDRKRIELTARQVLDQASAALWLLSRYGGVGSKSRKGFGSLQWVSGNEPCTTLDNCRTAGAELRAALGLSNRFLEKLAESPALGDPRPGWLASIEVPVPAENPWQVMDQVGLAYQTVAQQYKHQREKLALGLPRQIHGPLGGRPLRHQKRENWQPAKRLSGPQGNRHASPVVIHVEPAEGGYVVRALAFPSAHLPDLAASRAFLKEFMRQFELNLRDFKPPAPRGRSQGRSSDPSGKSAGVRSRDTTPRPPNLPKTGDRVRAVLSDERTRKGGWKAMHPATGMVGPIQNSGDVPGDWQPGQEVELVVRIATPREIAFRYEP